MRRNRRKPVTVGIPLNMANYSLYIQYSKDNIRINAVCPGITLTPMLMRQIELYRPITSRNTLNRFGTVQEIADVVMFMSSSRATFVQGAAYVVDGGYTIH